MLGATEVTGEGVDPLQRRLLNVVEEMALASGLPVPDVFILEHEAGINAFAAGLSPADAAVTVTRGALEQLDRAELQGVIAHEFSHILNGDMRLNQQLIGLSFGILVLSLAGRWLLRSTRYRGRGRNSGGMAAAVAIGVALTVIGAIGMLCSRLIKAGVSRQRERLADASAVQFTREPQGLAGALKKIGGYTSRIASVETEEVAHMLFEHSSPSFSGWLATHPPLLERIRALEPHFDARDLPPPRTAPAAPNTGADGPTAALAPADAGSPGLLERAGEIDAPAVGGALRDALPDEIYHATRSRDSSLLLVLALAIATDEATRRQQLRLLEQQLGAARLGICERLLAELQSVEPRLRLPILELALPALKQRPAEQLTYLFELLGRLGEIDASRRLFDFVLLRVLAAYLPAAAGMPRATQSHASPLDAHSAIRTLLGNVAAYGHEDTAAARAAYAAGLTVLGWPPEPRSDPAFDPPTAARDLDRLDAALVALARLRPQHKERLLRSVLATIRADGAIAAAERELFRAIAAALDCPLPPGHAL
jgi:Zn-dependent protease with chaperone function